LCTGYGSTAPATGPIFPRPVAPEQDYRGEAYRGATTSPHEAGRPWGYGTPAAHGLDAPSIPGATFAGDPATRDAIRSPFRLLGHYWDEELELACTRFRYWDPEAGRWCSPDPLGITGSLNLSGFNAAPTTHVDPLGLTKKKTGDNSKILAERLAREGRGP